MSSLLDSWKPPVGDTGIGGHMSAWHGDTRYTPNAQKQCPQLDADIALMKAMRMTRVKFLVQGNSQLFAIRAFAGAGFTVGIRWYSHVSEGFGALPENDLAAYQKAGATFCEGRINEYDNEAKAKPSAAGIKLLAEYWRSHADTCARVGLIPLSPAFEGDRLEDWVLPMVQYMLDRGWQDAVRGSIIAGHFRTGRYFGHDRDNTIPEGILFPPEVEPTEPGDRTGFCFRSYERWYVKLARLLGYYPIMQSTETFIEPHECRNDLTLHAALNVRMAQMDWRRYGVDCLYSWIMIPGGMGDASAWLDNSQHGKQLPVVKAFIEMLKPEPPVIPPVTPDPAPLGRDAAIRLAIQRELKWETWPWLLKMAALHDDLKETLGGEVLVPHGGKSYRCRAVGKTIWCCEDEHYTEGETFSVPLFA